MVNGVLLLAVDVLEIGLIEVKVLYGTVWHQACCFGNVFIDIEKEELVLSKDHDVVADLLY